MKKDIDLDLVGEELLDQQAGHRETRDLSLHVIPGYDDVLGLTVVTSQGGASESSNYLYLFMKIFHIMTVNCNEREERLEGWRETGRAGSDQQELPLHSWICPDTDQVSASCLRTVARKH